MSSLLISLEGNKDNYHSEEKGVWSEFAEDEMLDNMDDEDESPAFPSYYEVPADVDTALDLKQMQGGQIIWSQL